MGVLFLTGHLPYPRASGGRLREYELVTRLADEFEVHLCAVSKTYDEDVQNAGRLRDVCASVRVFAADPVAGPEGELPLQVPPPEIEALAGNSVVVTGRVSCIEPFLDEAAVVVAPLRIGGGIKIKVLEALCRGKAIVASSIAVQGLGRAVRDCVAVVDGPRPFADAVARLLEDPLERRRLERASRAFAANLPTWDDAARAVASCYRELAVSFADARSSL